MKWEHSYIYYPQPRARSLLGGLTSVSWGEKRKEKKRTYLIREAASLEEVPSTLHGGESKKKNNKKIIIKTTTITTATTTTAWQFIIQSYTHVAKKNSICIPQSLHLHDVPCCQGSSTNIPRTALSPESRFSQIHFHTRLRKYSPLSPGREKLCLK